MSRKAYKSDRSDEQWKLIEPLIPPAKPGGHPRTLDLRVEPNHQRHDDNVEDEHNLQIASGDIKNVAK